MGYFKTFRELVDWAKPYVEPITSSAENRIALGSVEHVSEVFKMILSRCVTAKSGKGAAVVDCEWHKEIINWLSDNGGKGLLLYGPVGTGKTLVGQYVIPYCVMYETQRPFPAFTIAEAVANPQQVMKCRFAVIDDIGTEYIKNDYGTKIDVLSSVVAEFESKGKTLVITTNLESYDAIEKRYGTRTADRLWSMCKWVLCMGESMRSGKHNER